MSAGLDRYRRFTARVEEASPRLSHRMRVAIAAACAERGFVGLYRHEPIPLDLAERALELAWAFALGDTGPIDAHRWTAHQLGDAIDELYADLSGVEIAIANATQYAIVGVDPATGGDALRWAINAISEAAQGDDDEAHEFAWLDAVLDRALATPDDAITRGMFGDDVPPWIDDDDDDETPVRAAQRHAVARAQRVATWRATASIPPWREPSGIPPQWEVKKYGQAPSSSQGKVSTSGHDHVGLFERGAATPRFVPESAVALAMSPDERTLFAWRVEKRAGASGIARGDYDWILDRYRWPGGERYASHVLTLRKTIEWCWPTRLDAPLEGDGRMVCLRGRSEDFVRCVWVVDVGGEIRETNALDEARAWLATDAH